MKEDNKQNGASGWDVTPIIELSDVVVPMLDAAYNQAIDHAIGIVQAKWDNLCPGDTFDAEDIINSLTVLKKDKQ